MDNLEPKKLALLRILEIFRQYSDCDHPLTQEEIASYLEKNYKISIERKAIGRNISLLKEAGYAIESGRNGSYLDQREFEDSELHMLIDGVLCSKYITAKHSKDLIDKLCNMSNRYFRSHVKNVFSVNDRNKTDNQALFYNIELIDDAIEQNKQISFDYNKYGIDKKLHRTTSHRASPYQLILHNQRYYLMALNERWKNIGYYRVDHITDMKITGEVLSALDKIPGFENGIDYRELSSALPYMYTDKPQVVEFTAHEGIIDQIVDWFGCDISMNKSEDKVRVKLRVSLQAMEHWAMQYINHVEIISPAELREKIKENLNSAIEKYN